MKKQILMAALFMGAIFTAKAQDTCGTAVAVTAGTHTVGTVDGTYVAGCWTTPSATPNAEWYSFTSPTDVLVRINTDLPANDPAVVDTRVGVFEGTCAALTCIAGSDDIDPAQTGGNYLTNFTFPAEAGVTYYIEFDDRWANTGFVFELTTVAPSCSATLPFMEDWSAEENFYFCWATFNPNNDALSWQYNNINDLNGDGTADPVAAIAAPATGNAAKNEWLISGGHNLVSGTEYTISVKYNGFSPSATVQANETLELVMMNEQDPAAAGQIVVGTITGITMSGTLATFEQSATTQTFQFTPNATDVHYLGLHATSPGATGWLFVFDVNVTGPLGTTDVLASQFSVYPNPGNDVVNITNADNILVNGVSIVDINGRTVKTVKFDNVSEAQINISDLATGMYLMNISSDKGTTTKKIMKN